MTDTTYLLPNGDGNYVQWIADGCANDWQCIDDPVGSDDGASTRLISTTNGWRQSVTLEDYNTGGAIVSVTVTGLLLKASGSSDNIRLFLRIGGTDYDGAQQTVVAPGTTFDPFTETWNTNPGTLAAWTDSDLDSLEAGVLCDSAPAGGALGLTQLYVTVESEPIPTAAFSATPLRGDKPLTVQFTDESTESPTSWSWNFGDGGTSTDQNPSYQYETAGTYTVSLEATNAAGSDTETKTDYITVREVGQPWETDIRIGSTIATMADVLLEPHVEFIPGEDVERVPCGGDRYTTGPRCRWTYPDRELTGEQFYQLKSLVGDAPSATVYIDIPTQTLNTVSYQPSVVAYEAIMHWPPEGVMMTRYYRWELPDEGILFTNLEAQ